MHSKWQNSSESNPPKARHTPILVLLLTCLVTLTGCEGGDNNEVELDLGSVSIGEQLIDLQKAHKANAISDAEFRSGKASLLLLLENVANTVGNQEGNDDSEIEIEISDSDDDDEDEDDEEDDADDDEEGDSGFLF